MRFRVGEDERRYGALRIEAYLRLLPLPAATVSEILRNWSKIEAILFWEGVKQGLAIGTLRAMDGRAPHEQLLHGASTAVAAHAAVYGEADTRSRRSRRSTSKLSSQAHRRLSPPLHCTRGSRPSPSSSPPRPWRSSPSDTVSMP